jgi:hypothetical protein
MKNLNKNTNRLGDYVEVFGQGYSSATTLPAEYSCFNNGTITSTGGGSNVLNFNSAMSFQDIQKSLNIDVSGEGSYGPFSASAEAEYARFVEDDQYSYSMYYFEQIKLSTNVWNPIGYGVDLLNPTGKGVYNTTSDAFRIICGDKIYKEVHEGIGLYATMHLSFSSHYERNTFTSKASGSFGDIASAAAQVKAIASKYDLSGEVDITAFQQGGDASRLPNIFQHDGDNYYITSCSFADFSACEKTVGGILKYAQSDLVNQTQNPYPLEWDTSNVGDLGINVGHSVVNDTVKAAREWLGGTYLNQTQDLKTSNHVINSQYSEYISLLPNFKQASSVLKQNTQLMSDPDTGVPACYKYPQTCIDIMNTINASLGQYNATMVEGFANLQGYNVVESLDIHVADCHPPVEHGQDVLVPVSFNNTFVSAAKPSQGFVSLYPEATQMGVSWHECTSNITKNVGPPVTYSKELVWVPRYPVGCINDYVLRSDCAEPGSRCGYPDDLQCQGKIEFSPIDNPL